MKITLVQSSPKLNRTNLDDILETINEYKDNSDIIIFPELCLNGYMLQDKLSEDAWSLDELTKLSKISSSVDVVVGGAIKEDGSYTNSALYFSKGILLSQHKKVHLPNYGMFEEARYFSGGDVFESFMNSTQRVSMLVCEDLWHKEVHKDLIAQNPDLIIALVASPARGFSDDGLEIEKKWYEIIKQVAKECDANLVFVNRVGFEDGLGFWGGSCVVDNNGVIIEKLPQFKTDIKTVEI